MTPENFFDSIGVNATDDVMEAFYKDERAKLKGDPIRQFLWDREAAIHGVLEAMQNVINAYKTGSGTEPSAQMAFEWLKRAAEDKRKGSERAYFDLAIAYRDGVGMQEKFLQSTSSKR